MHICTDIFTAHVYDDYMTVYSAGEQYTLSYGILIESTAAFSLNLTQYLRELCIPEISQHLPAEVDILIDGLRDHNIE